MNVRRSPAATLSEWCGPSRLRLGRLTLAAFALVGSTSAVADEIDLADLSLEQLLDVRVDSVYGASKYEQKVHRAPASITLVERKEIQRFGARTYAELLRSVRGMYVADDRNYTYLGVRGFLRSGDYNSRTLMLLDGHRLNENIFDSFYLDRDTLLDLDLIQRLEVVRGPSSSVYGSNAFFGVINAIPRRGADLAGFELAADSGSLGSNKVRLSYGTTWGDGGDFLISASVSESRGNRRLYFPEFDPRLTEEPRAANGGVTEGYDGESARQLYLAASRGSFKFTLFGSSRTREIPTASFYTAFGLNEETVRDDRGFADLVFDQEIADETQLRIRSYLDGYRYLGTYPYWFDDYDHSAGYYFNRDQAYGLWTGFEAHLVRRVHGRHTFLIGADYRANLRQAMFNFDETDTRVYYVESRQRRSTRAVYAEVEVAAGARWLFTGGIRYDAEAGSETVNPRLSAIVTPWEGGTVKLLYGSAFRAPNTYERGYLIGGSELRHETIDTYEVAIEQSFHERYRGIVSAYTYEVDDLITVEDIDDIFLGVGNAGRTSAEGIEGEFEMRGSRGSLFRTSWSVQRSKDRAAGEELTNSPRRLWKNQVLVPLWKNATAGVEVQYTAALRNVDGSKVPSFWLANLTLFHGAIAPGLTASASIYNLFDETYYSPGSLDHLQSKLQQNGRTFRVKLEYRF
ncbi:MAG TPA: TonB-dependent receptor [Candidatus Synoicihabitans sp.]|nr:TonB-dependent receptor [Candidatus Synoicihabitans sp.]